jgi:adenosylhomocysteine nucleosidase
MTIGIIGAMQLEVDSLIEKMNVKEERIVAGNMFYRGVLEKQEVVVTCCDVGKVNAASSTQILISEFHVDAIVNTGIAGGMHQEVQVCDVVISSDVTHHDVRQAQMASCYPNQKYFKSDDRLIELAKNAIEENNLIKGQHHIGRIVSGECFVADHTLKQSIIDDHEPHCVEMEGSSIGHVAYINEVPFVIIRSISDNADSDATMSYEAFEKIAADQSSKIVLNMLKHMEEK